ncbi:hypothetical protein, partial [Escherichia coli]|uniref:hypothetical protein n=1 Tax=Escherichia coli TaxID=562 RepID=UPI0020268C78
SGNSAGQTAITIHCHRQKPCHLGKIITPFLPRHAAAQRNSLTDMPVIPTFISPRCFTASSLIVLPSSSISVAWGS